MSLHLHEDMNGLVNVVEFTIIGSRHQPRSVPAFNDRGVIAISRDNPFGCLFRRRLDHAEQTFVLLLPVNNPARIEYLVPAMLRVRLGEHHEFGVSRVALQARVALDEIIDFAIAKCQAQFSIRSDQGITPLAGEWNKG